MNGRGGHDDDVALVATFLTRHGTIRTTSKGVGFASVELRLNFDHLNLHVLWSTFFVNISWEPYLLYVSLRILTA